MSSPLPRLSNYAAYVDSVTGLPRVGHFDLAQKLIQPLSFTSGTPVSNLYQIIEAGTSNISASGPAIAASSVKLLPPISGRDVLAVGKNYLEHAKEFNSSGFDSSDKVDRPTHPVIFTKRSTSIIADGEDIYPHEGFTETVDYEGEIGVIIGKPGFRISERDAMDHVWGFTIINDMTARERQRDHKQFYIGKSPDTFCPIGPIAVPREELPKVLQVQTHINGELRQNATTDDLIFSIPVLISAMSAGQTLRPGDVLATGTPAGVGIGRKPPVYLHPGDEITVSVTGLGILRNKIAAYSTINTTVSQVASETALPLTNGVKSVNGTTGLTKINSKFLNYHRIGTGPHHLVFVHGLGGTQDYYTPLISALALGDTYSAHVFDLEGHGLSPTHPLSVLSIESFAADIGGVFQHAGISVSNPGILFAQSMGCLAALKFALDEPSIVSKLVLIGPPPSPLPPAASKASYARAALVRAKGMAAVADAVVNAGASRNTKAKNPVAVAAVRLSLLGQDPESYAKACSALAGATKVLDVGALSAPTLIITGQEDNFSPPAICKKYAAAIKNTRYMVLKEVGQWPIFEALPEVTEAVKGFLSK